MGVKKYAPYRKTGAWNSGQRDRLMELKNKVKERNKDGLIPQDITDRPTKKRKGKKERQKQKARTTENADSEPGQLENDVDTILTE